MSRHAFFVDDCGCVIAEAEPPGATDCRLSHVLFREVNERISELTGSAAICNKLFICECGDLTCSDALEVTADEYQAVRADPTQFLIANGHEARDDSEWIVARNDRFLTVEKLGKARHVAIETDPRQR